MPEALGISFWRSQTNIVFYYLFLSQAYSKGSDFSYPIISDPSREIAVSLGMVDPEEKDKAGLPLTCRAVSLEQPALIIVLISGGGGGGRG